VGKSGYHLLAALEKMLYSARGRKRENEGVGVYYFFFSGKVGAGNPQAKIQASFFSRGNEPHELRWETGKVCRGEE